MISVVGNSIFSFLVSKSFTMKGRDCALYVSKEKSSLWQYHFNVFDVEYINNCLIDMNLLDANKKLPDSLSFKERLFIVDGRALKLNNNIKQNLLELLRKFPQLFLHQFHKELKEIDAENLSNEFDKYVKEISKSFYFYRNPQNYKDLFYALEDYPIIALILNSLDYDYFRQHKLLTAILGSTRSCIRSYLANNDLRYVLLTLLGPFYEFNEDLFLPYLQTQLDARINTDGVDFIEKKKRKFKIVSNGEESDTEKLILAGNPDLGEIQLSESKVLNFNSIKVTSNIDSNKEQLVIVLDSSIDPFFVADFKGDQIDFFYVYQSLNGQDANYYDDAVTKKMNLFFKSYYPYLNFEVKGKEVVYDSWNEWDLSKSYLRSPTKNPVKLKLWNKKESNIVYYGHLTHSKLSGFYQHFYLKNKFGL